jgi:hypothetical protein
MSSTNDITFQVRLSADQAIQSIKTLDDTVKRASADIQKSLVGGIKNWFKETGFALSGIKQSFDLITSTVKIFTDEAIEAEQGLSKVAQAIRSTGGAAGWSAEGLKGVADQLERTVAVDADEIMNRVTLPLLTFTKIAGGTLPQAQEAVLNMSRALGVDLQGAAMQVGKALQDPTVGLTALRRSGVSFSDDQVKVIKGLMETGKAAEAQQLILAELNKEFGGQAAAYAKTYAGRLEAFNITVNNLKESIGKGLLPILTAVVKPLGIIVTWFTQLGTAMKIIITLLPLAVAGIYKYNAAAIAGTVVSGGLTGAITAVGVAIKGFLATMGPVGLILTLLGLLAMLVENTIGWGKAWIYIKNYSVAALKIAWEYLKGFGIFLWNFTKGMIEVLTLPWQIMYRTASNIFSKLASIMKKLVSGDFAGVWSEIKSGFTQGFEDSISSVGKTFSTAMNAWTVAGEHAGIIWNQAGHNAEAALLKANTTEIKVSGQGPGGFDDAAGETAEDKAKREKDEADKAASAKLTAEANYYEQMKFLDKGYFDWKLGQYKKDIDAQLAAGYITQQQHDTLLSKIKTDLEAERDKPVTELIDKYKELMATMADSKTVGVQSWNGIAEALAALRDEMLTMTDDPKIAGMVKDLNEKILIAQGNAAKETKKTNWFWKMMGFDENKEGDTAIIQQAMQSYQTIMSGISSITNSIIEQNNQKRQAELARIDEIAKKEKWSAESIAASKDAINKKFDAKERKMKEVQKAMAIVQAGINTAEAVTKALTMGGILGPIMAGIIGAMGLVQIAFIKAQKFARGGAPAGLLGGVGGPRDDGNLAWFSRGEYLVNAESTKRWLPVLEAINGSGFAGSPGRGTMPGHYAEGGEVKESGINLAENVKSALQGMELQVKWDGTDAKSVAKFVKKGELEWQGATF